MKRLLTPFVIGAVLITVTALHAQESVCDLFSHLGNTDGRQVVLTGDLVISKDIAVLGAADCENQYTSRVRGILYGGPRALSLRPSASVTSAQLQQFQNAATKADRLRKEGKTVSASASFSGHMRVAPVGDLPGELTFDSFRNLKVEALPDPGSLAVTPICELFQNLPAWKGKRIAVRGEFISTMEGAWIYAACKGAFVTDGYRWPVSLVYALPWYYLPETAKLYPPEWPSRSEFRAQEERVTMATFVGVLRMRSKYEVFCVHGRYVGIGFGHLSSAAAVLEVESVRNVELTPRPDTPPIKTADTAQLCTPPDPAILCAKADSLLRAASIGCIDRVREFLAKTGIDSKNGSESLALRVAVKTGDDPMVKVLLNAGAPVNPVDPTRSPLAEAASARQIGAMKLLLAAGAKVDSVDHDGATLLGQGTVDPRVAEVLLEAGAQVDAADANGETALMKASASGFEKIMKVLIEHHADLNLKDKQGRTALMHAAASPYSLAVALLLENGADPNARDNRGKTALDLAEESNNMEAFVELSLVTKESGAR